MVRCVRANTVTLVLRMCSCIHEKHKIHYVGSTRYDVSEYGGQWKYTKDSLAICVDILSPYVLTPCLFNPLHLLPWPMMLQLAPGLQGPLVLHPRQLFQSMHLTFTTLRFGEFRASIFNKVHMHRISETFLQLSFDPFNRLKAAEERECRTSLVRQCRWDIVYHHCGHCNTQWKVN